LIDEFFFRFNRGIDPLVSLVALGRHLFFDYETKGIVRKKLFAKPLRSKYIRTTLAMQLVADDLAK